MFSRRPQFLPRVKLSYAADRYNFSAKIKQYHGPLLISHGDADRTIPYEHGQKLFEAAPGPKRFVTITGGDHNSPQSEEYRQALDELLAFLSPQQAADARMSVPPVPPVPPMR